jgi:hypothetical protein
MYPNEVSCLVALDSLLGSERSSKSMWQMFAHRIDTNLKYHTKTPKIHKSELTYEKAMEL